MAKTMRVKVRDGVGVYDGERHRTGGETVTVDTATGQLWIAKGWVDRVKAPRAKAKA